ncbi:MAG: phosphatidate cytidylyltransferase [Acidiferrobacteraceae bacterium]
MTALGLIALMIFAVFEFPPQVFAGFMGAIALAASSEWAGLNGLGTRGKAAYVFATAAIGGLSFLVPPVPLMIAAVGLWLWLSGELLFIQGRLDWGLFSSRWSRITTGIAILVLAWRAFALVALSPAGHLRSALLLVLVSFCDIAAYLVGKPFGRTKIASHVSPGKSAEGLAGAVAGVILLGYVTGRGVLHLAGLDLTLWTLVAVALALFSLVGDLTESRAKRIAGVKDSGHLLPGHGGVFDRIDGFTAAAPVYALASLWLSRP